MREVSDTKKEFKKLLRPAVFTLGGALAGLGYYALVGCSTGSCAITASPVNTMLYIFQEAQNQQGRNHCAVFERTL